MRLSNILGPLHGLWLGLTLAFLPTLRAILLAPRRFLLRPARIAHVYMEHVWVGFSDGVDGSGRSEKEKLITPHAAGRVLDIGAGAFNWLPLPFSSIPFFKKTFILVVLMANYVYRAGHGHTARYLDRARVTQYIALEPNTLMHARIRAEAAAAGFAEADGTLVVLACGAEDTDAILAKLSNTPISPASAAVPPVDTIVSVLTLCTVPSPHTTLAALVHRVLKPGGRFLMSEHVLSPRADVARWQRFWAPFWSLGFDGCRMDRATDVMVAGLRVVRSGEIGDKEDGEDSGQSAWSEMRTWRQEGLDEEEGGENMFGHSYGVLVKR